MTDSIVIRVLDMKKENIKQKRQHRNCLKCRIIPCINFYRKGKVNVNELDGGEIYFLKETIKEKLITPCLLGCLIYPMCKLLIPLYEDEGKFSSSLLYHQCTRDLRASAFLLLTGHYRSSMQILRPVLENWLTGVYFDTRYHHSRNESEKEIVVKRYNDFLDGNFKITDKEWVEIFGSTKRKRELLDQKFLLEFMLKENLISREENEKLKNKVKELNKYLHPHFEFTDVGRPSCPSCPSSVKFDEKEYKECAELFQYITEPVAFQRIGSIF
ncbi:MAG: hypothetical protein OIN66_06965 [Candidatus Methanoperedens sp.]|nr:hypothetical protein [Candidatus Methanoperedens sp.]